MTVIVSRGIGHPWTATPGWDQMLLTAETRAQFDELVRRAREKFWRVWYASSPVGTEPFTAHLFKPSDATREWQDISWQGTPRGHGHQFRVGDPVYTDFSGRITQHEITAVQFSKMCQTGVQLKVKPPVPGSYHVGDVGSLERGRERVYEAPWMDAAWFRKVEA